MDPMNSKLAQKFKLAKLSKAYAAMAAGRSIA